MKSIRISSFALICFAALCRAQITSYTISTVVGAYPGTQGYFGDNGLATSAELNAPIAVALDSSGNLYIVDSGNDVVRKVTKSTGKIATFAGTSNSFMYGGDGGAATSASFNTPYGVAVDSSGNVYVSDLLNHAVRKINSSGTISTVAGTGSYGYSGDGGPGTSAQLNQPIGLALDSAGNLYIADSNNYCIRMLNTTTGIITTVAGAPTSSGFSGDGGPAKGAKMSKPFGLAMDSAGNLYIADHSNNRIREVSNGIITTIAGTGGQGFSGDGGPATQAQLKEPWGVNVDSAGNLYVADYGNVRIRLISRNGAITTLAGFAANYGGDGGPAVNATLNFPTTTVWDPSTGNVYIADTGNNVIRLMTPGGPTVSAAQSAGQFGAFSAVAPGSWIEIYGANLATNARSWTLADFNGVNAPTSLDGNSVTIGGQAAFVDYISGNQVNVQVPSNVSSGQQPLVVTNANGGKATYTVTVNAAEPGIFAPSQFVVGGKQYAGAVANNGLTFIMPPGAVSGITSQRANPGDRITFYGVGFGPVAPAIPAGQVVPVSPANSLAGLQVQIGGQTAQIQYAGLAPEAIGLYQFNVYVPTSATANDLTPVAFTLNGTPIAQTLYIAVQ